MFEGDGGGLFDGDEEGLIVGEDEGVDATGLELIDDVTLVEEVGVGETEIGLVDGETDDVGVELLDGEEIGLGVELGVGEEVGEGEGVPSPQLTESALMKFKLP